MILTAMRKNQSTIRSTTLPDTSTCHHARYREPADGPLEVGTLSLSQRTRQPNAFKRILSQLSSQAQSPADTDHGEGPAKGEAPDIQRYGLDHATTKRQTRRYTDPRQVQVLRENVAFERSRHRILRDCLGQDCRNKLDGDISWRE